MDNSRTYVARFNDYSTEFRVLDGGPKWTAFELARSDQEAALGSGLSDHPPNTTGSARWVHMVSETEPPYLPFLEVIAGGRGTSTGVRRL